MLYIQQEPTGTPTPDAPAPIPPEYSPLSATEPMMQRTVRKEMTFERHDHAFAWIYLILGFLFLRYLIIKQDGLITTIVCLMMLILAAVYVRLSKKEIRASHKITWGILAAATLPFSLSHDPLLHTLCAVLLVIGTAWWVRSITIGCGFVSRFFLPDLADASLSFPLNNLAALPKSISHGFKSSSGGKKFGMIALGIGLAIFPTLVIGGLLASADAGMERMLAEIAYVIFSEDLTVIVWQLMLAIPTAFFLYAGIYSNQNTKLSPVISDEAYERLFDKNRNIPNLILYTSLIPIFILYITYVVSQLSYFASAFADSLPMRSYSVYARRGFFELCWIAVINLIILLILNGCAKQSGKNAPRTLKIFGAMLCGFTLFIILTAIAKMGLYMANYGLTRKRVLTFWFMLLLTVCFLVLLVRQFKQIPTAKILTTGFLILFAALCIIRPDALIAKYNISRYADGTLDELDLSTLCGDLSDDAYVVMLSNTDIIEQSGDISYFKSRLRYRHSKYEDSVLNILNLSSFLVYTTSYEFTT